MKDSLVDNIATDIYKRSSISVRFTSGDTSYHDQGYLYVQNFPSGLIKYSLNGMTFDTLYDFSLESGQSYLWYERIFNTGWTFQVTVLDYFDYEQNDGLTAIAQVVELDFGGSLIDTIYPGFGSKKFYILPYDLAFENVHDYSGLPVCYQSSDGEITTFIPFIDPSGYNHDCQATISSTQEIPMTKDAILFPNPSRSHFTIRLNGGVEEGVRAVQLVSSVTGRVAAKRQLLILNGRDIAFPLDGVEPGAYYVRMDAYILGTVLVVP